MKPKNIANWMKDNLERMAEYLESKEIEDFEVRLKRIREKKEKKNEWIEDLWTISIVWTLNR